MKEEIDSIEQLSTHQKALQVNLDPGQYGTIVEIGAGQEVSRWFFRVGAAAGTVAKTMSAYDMSVSDSIYGKSSRYVSEERLEAMLNHEWDLLLQRLTKSRGEETCFFTFADTVSARNFKGTNICHGWMAVRFQSEPNGEPNTISLHVNMHDDTNFRQQQAVGILGVNLIYGALHNGGDIASTISELLDGLSLDEVDVDYIKLEGPLFDKKDQRAVLLSLLTSGATTAIGFTAEGAPSPPMTFLYKCPILLERGSFSSVEKIHGDLLTAAEEQFARECHQCKRSALPLFELTCSSLNTPDTIQSSQAIERIDKLLPFNKPILVTSYPEGYHLTRYLRRYTPEPIRFTMGLSHFMQVFEERYYNHLSGGIIEGLGRLIGTGVRIYVYPMPANELAARMKKADVQSTEWDIPTEGEATLVNIRPTNELRHLYCYLFETGALVPIKAV